MGRYMKLYYACLLILFIQLSIPAMAKNYIMKSNTLMGGIDGTKYCNFISEWRIIRKKRIAIPYLKRECLTSIEKRKPRKYLIEIHGGPHTDIDIKTWSNFEIEVMMRGYTLIEPNYTGSASRDALWKNFKPSIETSLVELQMITAYYEKKGKTLLSGSSAGGFLAAATCIKQCGEGIFILTPVKVKPSLWPEASAKLKNINEIKKIDEGIHEESLDRLPQKARLPMKIKIANDYADLFYGSYANTSLLKIIKQTPVRKKIFIHFDQKDEKLGSWSKYEVFLLDKLSKERQLAYYSTNYIGHDDPFAAGDYIVSQDLIRALDWVAGERDTLEWIPNKYYGRPVAEIEKYIRHQKAQLAAEKKK
jgi:hypothetical protein